jgi:hypothetical protein
MTRHEQMLLNNVLDALDRLYDRVSKVIDVRSLIVATAEALPGSEFAARAEPVLKELQEILRSERSPAEKRDLALGITDDLRQFLAKTLPFDDKI